MSNLTHPIACPECHGSGSSDEGSCVWCDSTGAARCEARTRWTGLRQIRCTQDAAVMAVRAKGDAFPACLDCVSEFGLMEVSDVAA